MKLSRTEFSKAVAAVLKASLPQLGTSLEMPGADTVDELARLYEKAKLGHPLAGMPVEDSDLQPGDVIRVKGHTGRVERAAEIGLGWDVEVLGVLDALKNSQATVDATAGHRVVKALAVLLLTPHIRQYLETNDPQALKQAVAAITEIR
jgi:hypothetical protein